MRQRSRSRWTNDSRRQSSWEQRHPSRRRRPARRRGSWSSKATPSIVLPSDDVVLGRHPEDTDDAMLIDVPDPMRRLSRTHARLRRDATNDIWTIEDLGSSNGVSLYDSDTRTWRRVSPRQPIIATEHVALDPLRARLARRHDDADRCDTLASLCRLAWARVVTRQTLSCPFPATAREIRRQVPPRLLAFLSQT